DAMQDDALKRRLSALNRAPLPEEAQNELLRRAAAAADRRRHTRDKEAPPSLALRLTPTARPAPQLAGLVARGESLETERGSCLKIVLALDELWPGGERLVRLRHDHLAKGAATTSGAADSGQAKYQAELRRITEAFPGDLLLLDLETCGLAGAALFLVGVLRVVGDRIVVELLLARHYGEEIAVLCALWERITGRTLLGTFNGKSFDWPMVQDRTARHLLFKGRRPPRPQHVDLLHSARRRWRKDLPDCKLQTLETRVCGRARTGDIPGSLIPAAYEEFVRTGFTREMDAILQHNALDLVTLLDLAMRLAEPLAETPSGDDASG
ncbi:MAG: ribonuclease H-like domain-containing protein, partial [Planctomycetales bacterium]|nr:ribonuclease H-like domain-containing protein [Planctomycetales bacterium]